MDQTVLCAQARLAAIVAVGRIGTPPLARHPRTRDRRRLRTCKPLSELVNVRTRSGLPSRLVRSSGVSFAQFRTARPTTSTLRDIDYPRQLVPVDPADASSLYQYAVGERALDAERLGLTSARAEWTPDSRADSRDRQPKTHRTAGARPAAHERCTTVRGSGLRRKHLATASSLTRVMRRRDHRAIPGLSPACARACVHAYPDHRYHLSTKRSSPSASHRSGAPRLP